jgi:hypothetical protein
MASASFKLSLALGETGGAAFVTLHTVLGRLSRLKLRRFSGVGLGSEATAKSLNLGFAVTGMTFSLATRRVNLDEYFIFGDLRRRCGLWGRLLTSLLASQAFLFGRPVERVPPSRQSGQCKSGHRSS